MYKMLLATDFSEAALNAYRYCLSMTSEVRSEVHIVHVFNSGGSVRHEAHDSAYQAFLTRARKFSRLYPDITDPKILQQVAVEVEVTEGQVTQRILALAKEHKVDLLVIGSKAHPGIFKRMFGHYAKGLIHGAPMPLLVVPEHNTHQRPKRAVLIARSRMEEMRMLGWMDDQAFLSDVDRTCCLLPSAHAQGEPPAPGHPDHAVHLSSAHLPRLMNEIERVAGELVLIEIPEAPDPSRDHLVHYLYDHLKVPLLCLHAVD